jgi:hypothetical protein
MRALIPGPCETSPSTGKAPRLTMEENISSQCTWRETQYSWLLAAHLLTTGSQGSLTWAPSHPFQ